MKQGAPLAELLTEPRFREACRDQRYLAERGYAFKVTVRLVGDRYRLDAVQRSVLRRGVVPNPLAAERQAKIIPPEAVAGEELSIDLCNVVAVVGNYLSGRPVYIAEDGLLRDAAESAGVFRDTGRRQRSVAMIAEGINRLQPAYIRAYIDAPLTHSHDLADELRRALTGYGLDREVLLVRAADKVLQASTGIIVTGDSEIIDVHDTVFDLSLFILTEIIGAEIFTLRP